MVIEEKTDNSKVIREIVATALKEGYQITEDALKFLKDLKDPLEVLQKAIRYLKDNLKNCFVLDLEHILLATPKSEAVSMKNMVKEDVELKILQNYEDEIKIVGQLDEFYKYFHSRYIKIKKILEERGISFLPLSEAMMTKKQEVNVAVMVLDKKDTEKAIVFDCEDSSGYASILVPKSSHNLVTKAERVLVDYVVGMKLKKINNSFIAQEIIMPDVPINDDEIAKGPDAIICFISDLHIGSKNFRQDLFERFLDWLNRGRDGEVKRLTHIFILGDLVDGVGIYPGQERELEIPSINDQFMIASKILSNIPNDIKLVYIPGNHEPVRKALPQPVIPNEYRKILEEDRKIIFGGNPVKILIGNRIAYLYHGQSLDDIIQSLPDTSYSNLQQNMGKVLEAVVQARHLAPCYGHNTPLLPLEEDPLVIDVVPSMLCTAHVHIATVTYYRKILLLNAGCWQDQTSYQRAIGLEPTVGTAILVDLHNMLAKIKSF